MASSDGLAETTQYVADALLKQGISLAHAGDRERAREAFRSVIQRNPEEELAWLWLARVAETSEDGRRYLQEAQTILPGSVRIAEALRAASDLTGRHEAPKRRRVTVEGARRRVRIDLIGALDSLIASFVRALRWLRSAATTMWRALCTVVQRPSQVRLPTIRWAAVARYAIIVVLVAAGAGLVFTVRGWVLGSRERTASVLAEALPTRDPYATPTPSIPQHLEPLWLEANSAMTLANWETAVTALQQIRAIDPDNTEARQSLAIVRLNQAQAAVDQNNLDEARAMLDEAVRLDAACPGVAEERRTLNLYLDGLDAYWTRDWETAVSCLSRVHKLHPGFKDTRAMLGQAYYEIGVSLQADGEWFDAQDAMNECLALLPDHQGAPQRLGELDVAITPPRRIEVCLSQFTCTLYENDEPFRTFIVCHGRKSAPTVPGRYEIQSKMPSAYGSAWDLWMPYWLGIYDAGGSENGFHALPILSSGAVLWGGALGTQCSFGCIVLDTADAEYLYNWADIGTVVFVHE